MSARHMYARRDSTITTSLERSCPKTRICSPPVHKVQKNVESVKKRLKVYPVFTGQPVFRLWCNSSGIPPLRCRTRYCAHQVGCPRQLHHAYYAERVSCSTVVRLTCEKRTKEFKQVAACGGQTTLNSVKNQ